MKKFLAISLCILLLLSLCACGDEAADKTGDEQESKVAEIAYDDIPDNCETEDGTYEVALVTNKGLLNDDSFNEFTWNGCKSYAYKNGLTYKYYQPKGGFDTTNAERVVAMKEACNNGAKVVVTPGFLQALALQKVAPMYPEVQFIFIDGFDLGLENIVGISYCEEQAGYFAGYAAVMEGYERLGFSGGGGGDNPACIRYGYGFAQGINDAAGKLKKQIELRYSWKYGEDFSPSIELQRMLEGWYESGTQAIFVCGGTMLNSCAAAAEAKGGKIIGVDVDQSLLYDTVITSAMKNLAGSVEQALDKFFSEGLYSGELKLGASAGDVGLPTDSWALKNWTVGDYKVLYQQVVKQEITISDDSEMVYPDAAGLNNITFIIEPI